MSKTNEGETGVIQLTISGDDPTKFYNEAMNALLLLAQGGNQVFKPSTPPVVDQPVAPVEVRCARERRGVQGANYYPFHCYSKKRTEASRSRILRSPKKRRRRRSVARSFRRVEKIIEAVAGARSGAAGREAEEFTLDDMRDRVKAIVQAHLRTAATRCPSAWLTRESCSPRSASGSQRISKPEQFNDFWAASRAYLDGTAK